MFCAFARLLAPFLCRPIADAAAVFSFLFAADFISLLLRAGIFLLLAFGCHARLSITISPLRFRRLIRFSAFSSPPDAAYHAIFAFATYRLQRQRQAVRKGARRVAARCSEALRELLRVRCGSPGVRGCVAAAQPAAGVTAQSRQQAAVMRVIRPLVPSPATPDAAR